MPQSPLDAAEPSGLPASDTVAVVACKRAPCPTVGISRARSFWDTVSHKNNYDDGAMIRCTSMNKTTMESSAIKNDPVQHSSILDDCRYSAVTGSPKVDSSSSITWQETRNADNTSTSTTDMILSADVVTEIRDLSSMDEGNATSKGTWEPEDTPNLCHQDPSEEEVAESILPMDVSDPSGMQEGNPSVEATPETSDTSFPTMRKESSVALQKPFHYHRDLQEDEAILPTDVVSDVRNPSDLHEGKSSLKETTMPNDTSFLTMQRESSVDFQIPFHYHRDLQEVGSTAEAIPPNDVATDLWNPLDMHEENASLKVTLESIDTSVPTRQEESRWDFRMPFHYHRDAQWPLPKDIPSSSVSKHSASNKANIIEVEGRVEVIIHESCRTSQNDEEVTREGSFGHQDPLEGRALLVCTSRDSKCKDIIPSNDGGISNISISTKTNSIDESLRQESSGLEIVVNTTVEEMEERSCTKTEFSQDDELRLVAVGSMSRGTAKHETESQEDVPKKNDTVRTPIEHQLENSKSSTTKSPVIDSQPCDSENIAFCLQNSQPMKRCPEQSNDVQDNSPSNAAYTGNDKQLNLLSDPELPVVCKIADSIASSHDNCTAAMESAISKSASMDTNSIVAGMDCSLSTQQSFTCSISSGVKCSSKNKDAALADGKPESSQVSTRTSRILEEWESDAEDDKPSADSLTDRYNAIDNYSSWEDDARNIHKPVDIEQSQFESKYKWALEKMFCGSLDSMPYNDGHEISKALTEQANEFVPKHFTSIFQEDDMSLEAQTKDESRYNDRARVESPDILGAQSTTDGSMDDGAGVSGSVVQASILKRRNIDHYIDDKASVSTCTDMDRHMYIHASSTCQSDMTEPTASTILSGSSLTARDSIQQLSEAMTSLPLKLQSTGESAARDSLHQLSEAMSLLPLLQSTGKSAEEIQSQSK
jgi:hypothetical protein